MSKRTIMVVAGEASGDQHAADVIRALKARAPELEAFGFGGEMLKKAGMALECDLVSHAVIGITEAIAKIGDFFRILKLAERLLRQRRPHLLMLTDFPDLNFRIAAKAKALGIPVVYYISPQIWAWRQGRIRTIKRLVDHMLVIFPFEEPLYREFGIPVTFVGHPLLDVVKPEESVAAARQRLLQGSAGPLVALLPGSRVQEINLLLPVMAAAAKRMEEFFPEVKFIIPLARTVRAEQVTRILRQNRLDAALVVENVFSARAAADVAIVASGTATLETAILGTPMLIGYRMQMISYLLARVFVKLPYFGLANLAAGEKIAPEFLQGEFTAENIFQEAKALLTDAKAAAWQRECWAVVRNRLGGSGAAVRAAEVILQMMGLHTCM
ncbi:lipid-A-disaccharide synthase [candidate division FCPU426 bacterium]|nr:lipid-A-disaccharide synthase [candidate division FCPU426 bacterium]